MSTKKSVSLIASITVVMLMLACSAVPLPFVATSTSIPTNTSTPTPQPTSTPTPNYPIATLKIVSSLPMSGISHSTTQTIVNAEILRLEQANYSVCGGKYKVEYEAWDDASAALGKWDPALETENANNAVTDNSIIAYLGTFNSGAARLSIPILNEANLVMISPANTYPGLTKPGKGDFGEPDKYYPSGTRNYARVSTADDVQGSFAAHFMKDTLSVNTVYIIDDQELYGQILADSFETAAKKIGLTVVGRSSIDPSASSYKSLMKQISTSNNGKPPDAIYASMVVDNNAGQLIKDKVAVLGDNTQVKFMGPDGIQTQYFIDVGGNATTGVYATVGGLPFEALPDIGQQFIKDYESKYGSLYDPYAVYGYEAMNVLLKAIEDVCASGGDATDRDTVRAAVFAIKDFNGALGTWSFDENGDISLTDMTVYQVKNSEYAEVGVYK